MGITQLVEVIVHDPLWRQPDSVRHAAQGPGQGGRSIGQPATELEVSGRITRGDTFRKRRGARA